MGLGYDHLPSPAQLGICDQTTLCVTELVRPVMGAPGLIRLLALPLFHSQFLQRAGGTAQAGQRGLEKSISQGMEIISFCTTLAKAQFK